MDTVVIEKYGRKVTEVESAVAHRRADLDEKYEVIVIGSGPNGLVNGSASQTQWK